MSGNFYDVIVPKFKCLVFVCQESAWSASAQLNGWRAASVAFQAFVQFMVLGLKPSKKPHLLLDLRPDVDRPKVKKQITKFGIFFLQTIYCLNLFQLSL